MATTNKLVIGFGSIAAIAAIAFASSAAVLADSENGQNGIVERIATKFNLNADEVQAEFKAFGQERQAAHLDEAVAAGTITEDQKQLLIDKKEEMRANKGQNSELSQEERQAAREANRAEMQAWAEENGIDLEALHEGQGEGGPRHQGGKRGFGGPGQE